jgi:hypothetical protein
MGAIKDIVDLCIKLRDENRDGKIAAALGEIQSLTLALQSEQATIVEKNSELVTENLGLKRKMLEIETTHAHAITALQEKHRAEISKITAANTRPKGDELAEKTQDILLYYFKQAREVSEREIAHHFKIELSVAAYHLDLLWQKDFLFGHPRVIVGSGFGDEMGGDTSMRYEITVKGRKYVVEKGLAG